MGKSKALMILLCIPSSAFYSDLYRQAFCNMGLYR